MKLSLSIIKERLDFTENSVFFKKTSDALCLGRPVYYTDQPVLKSNTLYIAKADMFPASIKAEKDAACICIGDPKKRVKENIDQLLILPKDTDLFAVSNQITAIFDQFDNWENELFSAAYISQLKRMYQRILDASSDIFDNGLAIMNNTFHIIFQNETNILYGGYPGNHSDPGDFAIPEEIISSFKYDKDYQKITEEHDVFYYEGEALPHRVLCRNIFQNNQFLFRIIVTECVRPFRESDELLLGFLASYFSKNLRQRFLDSEQANDGLAFLLTETIESGKSNRQGIESELKKKGWDYHDIYRFATIHVSPDDLFISTLSYYSGLAAQLIPAAIAFPYQDQILLLINETRSGDLESYKDAVLVFIRENNFRVGISNFSDDIYTIQIMYRQAEMALTIGLSEKPMEWIHRFSSYTLQYIFNMLTEGSDLGQLYSPIYYRLERYDKENGTSYLETLRVYLKCKMNAMQAAKELYIQRSTMMYRLKRIREIADNDLENQDDLLHLYLTFSIIERDKKE